MIIVMLNAYTALEGSFYGKSVTTGDWDDFVDSELVEHINSHYRTVANRGSRGLAGHSMGGYGTGRLGMRRPDVYSSFYAPRARYLDSGLGIRPTAEQVRAAQFALAAAFSPDPGNAPLFLDLPLKDGAPQPSVVAPCAANSPRNARPIPPQPAATQGNCL